MGCLIVLLLRKLHIEIELWLLEVNWHCLSTLEAHYIQQQLSSSLWCVFLNI